MTYERAMAPLNEIVDYAFLGQNADMALHDLLHMGFRPDELVTDFSCDTIQVADAAAECEAEYAAEMLWRSVYGV